VPPPSPGVPAQLFYSYSHKDENLRDQLARHLSALTRDKLISGWYDREMTAGTKWKGEIDDHLKTASVILLLVSSDFLASDYCNDVELKCALERDGNGEARVIPVILRPCDWQNSAFSHLQALPKNAKPVTRWSNRDEAWLSVVEGIRVALKKMGYMGSPATAGIAVANPPASSVSASTLEQISSTIPVLHALHQLAAPPADFTGRVDELKELLAAVKTGGVTISGLQGLGGVGKTALALKLAEQLKQDYPDAQFYLDLKGVTQPLTPRDAMAYIVRAWHPTAQLPEKEEELASIYRSVLDGKRVLLLMDNARDAQQVAPLIPPAGCLLLVTSRKHFTLPGLFEKNLDKLPPQDARDLLLRIASRLKKEKTDQVDELARLCGYLPLALRAVASALQTMKNISLADCVRNMADRRQRLKLTESDAALQSSYDLLSDDLRQKFRFLSVFPNTFDQAAAAAVWEIPPESAQDPLGELFAYSLVEFDETTNRYFLHDLVRLFVGELLNASKLYTAQKRHAGHYLEVLRVADALYEKGSGSVTRGLALFDLEVTNIRAGHDWVVAHQQDDDSIAEWCWEYPDAGVYCLSLRQHPRESIRWLEPALSAARRLKRRNWEGQALGNLGLMFARLGEYRRAIENYEKALEIVRDIGDRRGESAALGNLGLAYKNLGQYRRAIEYQEKRMEITRELGDRRGEGQALGNLGTAYDIMGEYRRGIECHEQSLTILREMGDRLGEGQVLGNLGLAYNRLGDHRRAIEYHEQNLGVAREIGDRRGEGNALGNLGVAYDRLGEHRRAIEYYEQSLTIMREMGHRLGEGATLGNLGSAYYNLGKYRRAIEYYEQQLQITREIGDRLGEANALFNSALALDQLGDRPTAIDRAEAALMILEAIESPVAARVRDKLAKWREEDKASGKIG
jgi:tetratricopeptide (TPR) repeat protein